ncbi:MAG TPA: hypothetical protein VGU70_18695 [Methylobacterium sp.]|jgi:hypothetical protein|uniref:hypothetical protein n=1 Tax=Methylorubrum sp. B1-46 TaxID=2897334 RepID=UPI001E46FFB4|nr:hypothetical protein [Methylorubrum sp. B1-46]UGB25867.1 hypothetical protein LPC10_23810 [Methylorubrum sp. B1-46]HEV2544787.1 hypothetical protein [Methylobacterium sp.]
MPSAGHFAPTGLLGGLALLAAAATPVLAQPRWVAGTYIYADLCTMPEDGAQTGRRITLKRWPGSDNLVYEGAGLPAPIETAVTVDDGTKAVAFEVETSAGPVSFRGTAGPDALVGTLNSADGAQPLRLKRVLRTGARQACPGETTGSIN